MTRPTLRGAAPLLILLAAPAAAQQEPFDLGELVLSATALPEAEGRLGTTVDVLTEEALERAPLSLADALTALPGVSASRNGGLGASTTLRIRGLGPSYVGVRIDGIDVTDPSATQTGFDFGGLTAAGIGRVEVIRGTQSALYGSEAVAGVVDITTDVGTGPGYSAGTRVEAGSFGTRSAAVGMAYGTDRGRLAFNLSRVETDGFSARSFNDEADGFEQTFLTFSGRGEVAEGLVVGVSALLRDATVEIDRAAPSQFDPLGDAGGVNDTRQRGLRAFAELQAFGIDHAFAVSRFDSDRRDPGGFATRFEGDRTRYEYLGTYAFDAATFLSVGLDRTEEGFDTDAATGATATSSALAELRFRPAPTLDASLTVRYDDPEDFGGAVSGRAALAWQAGPDATVRAVLGTGFRAPSLFERFSAFGDPDLGVEDARSLELGVERRFARGAIEATAFRTRIEDLIGFDGAATSCGSGFGCYVQTEGTTETRGVEVAGRYELGRATLFGAYTYTDAETEGERLALVPRHDLLLGVEGDLTGRLAGTLDLRHVADVEPSAFAPEGNLVGDHTVVGAGLSYGFAAGTEAYLRIENLLDEQYETAGGFNTSDRALYVGLRSAF
ncbi:vitamin B12 transporter [Hasllibacter halocynthiae]|uniref:Vitamin B12 transporter n=1 Tax=Hasllibacter halocynthiae TaxID=595589 RepID=A0A2T0WZ88_9RHOB|nr:TonB-dependent receptor [Hasllibacter halocynthiae]PRY92022.1 vitamin B12 transporter [Hasllibacter halocynthiae]